VACEETLIDTDPKRPREPDEYSNTGQGAVALLTFGPAARIAAHQETIRHAAAEHARELLGGDAP
jgi:hypothetical protein